MECSNFDEWLIERNCDIESIMLHVDGCQRCATILQDRYPETILDNSLTDSFKEFDFALTKEFPVIASRRNHRKQLVFVPVAAAILIGLFFFGRGSIRLFHSKLRPLKGLVVFTKGSVFKNSKKIKLGDTITKSDIILTGKKSKVLINFANCCSLTLKANTKLVVEKLILQGKHVVAKFSQKSGSSFSKVMKQKGHNYQIVTPAAVAGVRGTSFSVKVLNDKRTKIALLDGSLGVTQSNSLEKNLVLAPGEFTFISNRAIEPQQKLKPEELQALAKDREVASIVDSKVIDSNNIIGLSKKIEASLSTTKNVKEMKNKSNKNIQKLDSSDSRLTLAKLKLKYGKLTQIVTNDNKSYIGANWQQKGNFHLIITVKGPVKIATNKVLKVLPIE